MEKTYPMAFIANPGRIEFREKKQAKLNDYSVLLKVKAASICGGDIHIFKGKHPMSPLPVAIGHELSGVVLKTGTRADIESEYRIHVKAEALLGDSIPKTYGFEQHGDTGLHYDDSQDLVDNTGTRCARGSRGPACCTGQRRR